MAYDGRIFGGLWGLLLNTHDYYRIFRKGGLSLVHGFGIFEEEKDSWEGTHSCHILDIYGYGDFRIWEDFW